MELTKEVKDLYNESYKTLLKETIKDINKWKHILCSWIKRLNIIKMPVLMKAIYRFNAIPIKIPMMFLAEIQKPTLKFIWNLKGLPIAITILNKSGGLTLPNYKAPVIKTVWYLHKDRHINKWNRIESPQVIPYVYGQVIFDKAAKTIQ